MANLTNALLSVSWVLFGLATIVIVARFYTRAIYLRNVRSDDYLMFGAWLFGLYNACLGTVAVTYGLGAHLVDVDPTKIPTLSLLFVLIKFPSIFGSYLSRLSFSVTLLMIIRNTHHRKTRILVWATIAYESFFTLFAVIQIYAQCGIHTSELVSPTRFHQERCQDPGFERDLGYVQSAANSLADLALAAIPFFLIRSFDLPKDVKRWSMGLCLLGFVAFAASAVKAVQISRLGQNGDFTYNFAILTLAVYIETNILLVLMSLPSLRPLKEATKRYAPFDMMTHATVASLKEPDIRLTHTNGGSPDGDREKDAMSEEEQSGIRAVTEVEVTYETRRDDQLISQRILYGF